MEEKKTEEKITDTQLIKALEENEENHIIPPVLNRGMDFRIIQRVFSRSIALLMLSLVLSTGILISSVATSFISAEHSFVLAGFKVFCILSSLVLIMIAIFLVVKINTPQNGNPRNTLREYY